MLEQIAAEGRLANHLVRDRQQLYKGMNGRYVERISLVTGETLLFKPLTNNGQHGREAWIYEHVLSWLPDIYPRMIAHSHADVPPEESWLMMEDLGPLDHRFNEACGLCIAPPGSGLACSACG